MTGDLLGNTKALDPDLAERGAGALERLRRRAPRIHCLTNAVAQSFTANVLLALGAVPSMTAAPEEVAAFVAGADALLVNLGTLDRDRREAMTIAVDTALADDRRFVLDPVFVERSPLRLSFAKQLVARGPAVIRANRAECAALSGDDEPAAFAARAAAVVAQTGAADVVTNGQRSLRFERGHPLMARVTAMGCATSAVVAAFLTVEPDPLEAAFAALATMALAGDRAGREAVGPGSFVPTFLDALYRLDGADFSRLSPFLTQEAASS